jgi:hypothetical protein
MQDPRWSDPLRPPLSNGPLALTTPPAVPQFRLDADGQLVEFLLSFPTHIVDEQPWSPLQCKLGDRLVSIQKPLFTKHAYAPPGRIGNELPDAFCSIIRVHCLPDATRRDYPTQGELWPIIELLLRWMRVKGRHYWLLHGHTGFDSLYRGSVMTQEASQIGQRNFAGYGSNLIARPLEQDLWLTFRDEINISAEPPVSESVFCDALISVVAGDEVKAVLELGVAAEIEMTQLLADVSGTPPATSQKNKFLTKKRHTFYEKLEEWPQKLGLQPAQAFDPTGNFKQWPDLVTELYKLRGSVAHSGKLAPITGHSPTNYLMATNVLLDYCREQRRNAGIPIYSYPGSRRPFEQIVAFKEGLMSGETNAASGILT